MKLIETLSAAGVVPVIAIDDIEKAVPLARALVEGGLPVLEITFRTSCAAEAIARIRAEVPEATVIAGTVINLGQLESAQAAGAEACVSPGFDPVVVEAARSIGMPFCPGTATAGEMCQALRLGCEAVKFFPAESAGGVKYLKDILGAIRWTGLRVMPTGGVNPANLASYLAVPEVLCCGGTWVAPKSLIASSDWPAITRLASEAAALAKASE